MRAVLRLLCVVIVGGVLAVAVFAAFTYQYAYSPGGLTTKTQIIIERGTGFKATVTQLEAAGVIRYPLNFIVLSVYLQRHSAFKAGEYAFEAGITPIAAIEKLSQGDVVVHKITIPEGLTSLEIKRLVENEQGLRGDLPIDITEGSLLPETYYYVYGDTKSDLIARMQRDMRTVLGQLWINRKPGLPIINEQQALILASIVEKETGEADERARVAAVFVNRLTKGMRLQSDPTVSYGIQIKNGAPLNRSLTLTDLAQETPYNTYVISGLPPTPIANPGRKAIEATLHPAETNDLYFVATGTGGHNFAETLKEHNENVRRYRQLVKAQQN